MAGKKETSALWRQTPVVIRADILEQACLQKINISEACNQVLAERLGIDFLQQKIPEGAITEPVIIAQNEAPALPGHLPGKNGALASTAIINADDPLAAKTIKSKNLPREKPSRDVPAAAPVPDQAPAMKKEALALDEPTPRKGKGKKGTLPRKMKDDAAKKFFTSMILREDTDTTRIPKDELYYTFERWCRNNRILSVPDKKSFSVTLKNQFAVKEMMVNGTPTWVGVRVKQYKSK
jgi:hypothetical protein